MNQISGNPSSSGGSGGNSGMPMNPGGNAMPNSMMNMGGMGMSNPMMNMGNMGNMGMNNPLMNMNMMAMNMGMMGMNNNQRGMTGNFPMNNMGNMGNMSNNMSGMNMNNMGMMPNMQYNTNPRGNMMPNNPNTSGMHGIRPNGHNPMGSGGPQTNTATGSMPLKIEQKPRRLLAERSTKVYISKIPQGFPDELMKKMVQCCGVVASWRRLKDQDGRPKTFAVCEFQTPQAVLRCQRVLHEYELLNSKLEVRIVKEAQTYISEWVPDKEERWEGRQKSAGAGQTTVYVSDEDCEDDPCEFQRRIQEEEERDNQRERKESAEEGGMVMKEIKKPEPIPVPTSGNYNTFMTRHDGTVKEQMKKLLEDLDEYLEKSQASIEKSKSVMQRMAEPEDSFVVTGETSRERDRERRFRDREDRDRGKFASLLRELEGKELQFLKDLDREQRERERIEEERKRLIEKDLSWNDSKPKSTNEKKERKRYRDRELAEDKRAREAELEEERKAKEESERKVEFNLEEEGESKETEGESDNTKNDKTEVKPAFSLAIAEEEVPKKNIPLPTDVISYTTPPDHEMKDIKTEETMETDNLEISEANRGPRRKKFFTEEFSVNEESSTTTTKSQKVEEEQTTPTVVDAVDLKTKITSLLEKIPTDRDGLFDFSVAWDQLFASNIIEKKIRPWITKKVMEILKTEETSLIDYVIKNLNNKCKPRVLLSTLEGVLEEDASDFVMKLWRMVVFESLKLVN